MFRKERNESDDARFRQGVKDLGELFNIQDLEVTVRAGKGWSCGKTAHGLSINVDPVMLGEQQREEERHKGQEAPQGPVDNGHLLWAAAHELSHGVDFLDPSWTEPPKQASRHFFWNILDDAVIGNRLRSVPLLDAKTDDVYDRLFPPTDYSKLPKHVQLMYGTLLTMITPQRDKQLSPEVQEELDALQKVEKDGAAFDILDVLADRRTTLQERRKIAEKYMLPVYERLKTEDEQENKKSAKGPTSSQESQSGSATDPRDDEEPQQQPKTPDEHYKDYDKRMHGEHQDKADDKESDKHEENEQRSDPAKEIADVLKQVFDEQQKQPEEDSPSKQAGSKETAEKDDASDEEQALKNIAGLLGGDMHISTELAQDYAHNLHQWGGIIRQTAGVLLKLGNLTDAVISPRYAKQAVNEGLRLHPRRLAEAALQLRLNTTTPIWQTVERQKPRQEIRFGGLDIHLLVDISMSMDGPNARNAAACAEILLEALQLAQHKARTSGGQSKPPDVRAQVIAFGVKPYQLIPACYSPTSEAKGRVFASLMNPGDGSTNIGSALRFIQANAQQDKNRRNIIVIIGDGFFGDYSTALSIADRMPANVTTTHLVIGEGLTEFITPNHAAVNDPADLPSKLQEVLLKEISAFA